MYTSDLMLNEPRTTAPPAATRLLLDGGTGRELHRRGVDVPSSIWSAQALLDAPEIVREIHRDYIAAGADIITANTYGIIREKFEIHGLGDRVRELNALAVQLALDARNESDRPVLVAGSLPPLRGSYRPDLVGSFDELLPMYREQVEILAPMIDIVLCETMSHSVEACAAATAASATGKPVWVSFTLSDEHPHSLKSGEPIVDAVESLSSLPIAALLANCCKPETITAAMPLLAQTRFERVGGYANTFDTPPLRWTMAGEGRLGLRNDLDPETYARHARRWLAAGATLIGGCCGTTPDHIAQLRSSLEWPKPARSLG